MSTQNSTIDWTRCETNAHLHRDEKQNKNVDGHRVKAGVFF